LGIGVRFNFFNLAASSFVFFVTSFLLHFGSWVSGFFVLFGAGSAEGLLPNFFGIGMSIQRNAGPSRIC
jgi:hypothetical protein